MSTDTGRSRSTARRAAFALIAVLVPSLARAEVVPVTSSYAILKPDPIYRSEPAPAPTPAPTRSVARPTANGIAADREFIQVVDQDLRAVITEFAREHGLTADIASDLRQKVTNVRLPLDEQAFLAAIQSRYGVSGTIDGERLTVTGKSPVVSRLLPLGEVTPERLSSQIRAAAVPVDEHNMKYLAESNAVLLTAPAAAVAQVSGILDTIRGNADAASLRVVRYGVSRTDKAR